MVLVVIAFIGVMAGVLMFISFAGYQMRLIDRQGKDTFYSAETVLDEINIGLQQEVSAALTKAYVRVMVNYALYDTAQKRNEELYNTYYAELKTALQQDSAHPELYSISLLRGYISPEMLGDGTGSTPADGSRSAFGSYGAIVESNATPEAYSMVLKDTGVLLKDLKVSYVDKQGHVSIISTDIKIGLPAVNFSQSSEFPGISDYALIADKQLAAGNTFSGGSITFKGNVYAGEMCLGKSQDISILSSNIFFEKADGAEAESLARVVSRRNIEIGESSLTSSKTELWAENIILDSSKALLGGSINVKDDLILQGTNSEAVLSGDYTGFGISDADADFSSAIVINGKDSLLDLSGLSSMNISGRSYIATSYTEGDTVEDEKEKENKSDVRMGESVAVKSNQLIYLVPPEALGCELSADGSVGESKYRSNPLKLEQYEEIVNHPEQYRLLDGNREIAALGYKRLDNYISQESVAGGGTAFVPEVIFKKTTAGTLVYCYLRFTDEEAANRYFRDYYQVNAEKVNQYTRLYAKEIKMNAPDAMLYLHLAGNMLTYDAADAAAGVVNDTNNYASRQKAKNISITKSDIFKALSAKMVTNIAQLSTVEQERTVFSNVIYKKGLEDTIKALDPVNAIVQVDTDNPADIKSTILTRYDYVIDSSTPASVHMVISLGNVEVKKDFKGLIIAAGDIIVTDAQKADHQVVIEPMALEDFTEMMLAKSTVGTDEYYVLNVFRDGVNYAYKDSTLKDLGTKEVQMSDLIVYERWSKK